MHFVNVSLVVLEVLTFFTSARVLSNIDSNPPSSPNLRSTADDRHWRRQNDQRKKNNHAGNLTLNAPSNPTLNTSRNLTPNAPIDLPVVCSDVHHHDVLAVCWDYLNVSQYLEQWWIENEESCKSEYPLASFVSCYQQIWGAPNQQCDKIGPSHCNNPSPFSSSTSPQEAYVLYSIFAIWQWFNSLWQAIESADVSAQGPLGHMIQAINPIKSNPAYLGDILQAFTAITPLLTLEKVFTSVFQYLKTAAIPETVLRQSPGVFKQLAPTGTLDSQIVQMWDIENGLGEIKTTYQANVSMALELIQQNHTTFSQIASGGNFIAPLSSLQEQTVNLTHSLMNYMVSQCLTDVNMYITLARDTNPYELVRNGSLGYQDGLIRCDGYDHWGICDEYWYDNTTNAAYSIVDMKNPRKRQHDFMVMLFEQGWTTPEQLFLGSKACADYQACIGGIGANKPMFDLVTFQPRCLSNVQVCVWDQSCDGGDPTCEFTGEYGWGPKDECRPVDYYMVNGCGDNDYVSYSLPPPYLGPALFDGDPSHRICIDDGEKGW